MSQPIAITDYVQALGVMEFVDQLTDAAQLCRDRRATRCARLPTARLHSFGQRGLFE